MKIQALKGLVLGLIVSSVAVTGFAQGQINFFTFNAGNATRGNIFLADGTTPAGSDYVAQLWASDSLAGVQTPISTTIALSGGVANNPTLAVYPGLEAGNFVWYTVRVWNSAAGATWDTAVGNNPLANPLLLQYGTSALNLNQTRVTLGGVDPNDNSLYNIPQANQFNNLTLTAVPEPSTFALAGLGLASLLIFRRRK